MNIFLEMKKSGHLIPFSKLLTEIPPDDVLLELFSDHLNPGKQFVAHRGLEVLQGFVQKQDLVRRSISGQRNLARCMEAFTPSWRIL